MVAEQKAAASAHLLDILSEESSLEFTSIVLRLLRRYPLRETNVKDVCVALARMGKIENSWGGGNRKPKDGDNIKITKIHTGLVGS